MKLVKWVLRKLHKGVLRLLIDGHNSWQAKAVLSHIHQDIAEVLDEQFPEDSFYTRKAVDSECREEGWQCSYK